jgi:transposase
MAPHLAESQHVLARNMMASKRLFTAKQIAKDTDCSRRTIHRMRSNLRDFGSTTAPPNRVGRPRSITPPMLDALCGHLQENPGLYQEEMVLFLWEKFKVQVTTFSVARALNHINWTKKTIRRVANGRNADLRDLYLYNTSDFLSYQYVFVDESGCDERIGYRRTGWSPFGVTPVQVSRFKREKRYQILPAYTQDGVILVRVFQGYSSYPCVVNGQGRIQSLLWITHQFITQRELSRCVMMLV